MGIKTFMYKHRWFKQLVDQLGHSFGGFVMTLPMLSLQNDSWWGLFANVTTSMLAGLYREIDQMRRSDKGWYWDRTLDVLGHAPGGVLVWGIACWSF